VPKLFHLRCSPRDDSASSAAAEAFLARFRSARPNWDIDVMDLWRESLPEFTGEALSAKYARLEGRIFSDRERDAWAAIERMVLRLSLAERVLVSTPMWNFGVPYKLKHWIDLVSQPGLTFRFEPSRGYVPLLRNRPTLIIVASGSDFATGMNRGRIDMATPYIREALRFIGLSDSQFVLIGPTIGAAGSIASASEAARRRLAEIAGSF
jgi:FMN-dependent NADH-azoreductase